MGLWGLSHRNGEPKNVRFGEPSTPGGLSTSERLGTTTDTVVGDEETRISGDGNVLELEDKAGDPGIIFEETVLVPTSTLLGCAASIPDCIPSDKPPTTTPRLYDEYL